MPTAPSPPAPPLGTTLAQRSIERHQKLVAAEPPPPSPALSPARRAEIEARLAAATPGWRLGNDADMLATGPETILCDCDGYLACRVLMQANSNYESVADMTLAAHAPTDLRALLDEVARLTEEVEMGRRRERSAGEAHGRVLAALRAENERLEREAERLQDVTEALLDGLAEMPQKAARENGRGAKKEHHDPR